MNRHDDIRRGVDEELAFHFQERIAALVAEGKTQANAIVIAHAEFGNTDAVRRMLTSIDTRITRRRRRGAWLASLWQDLKYVGRSLAAAPAFTVLVVVTLGLGIGANGALFGLVDRLFLRAPSGVVDSGHLMRIYRVAPAASGLMAKVQWGLTYPAFADIEAALPPGAVLTSYNDTRVPIGRGENPEITHVAFVGRRYFTTVGVGAPVLGRYPTDEECRVDTPVMAAVLSYETWQRRFDGHADVLGQTIELQQQVYTVIGVAPRGFDGVDVDAVSMFLPLGSYPFRRQPPWYTDRNSWSVRALIRANDLSPEQLAAAATAAYRGAAPPREQQYSMIAAPLLEAGGPRDASTEIQISTKLIAVAVLVLLIACANVAGLLIARSIQRRRETAVRLALGISRRRLVGLFLTESLVLSLLAGALSLVIAGWGGRQLHRLLMPTVEWREPFFDVRVAVFTFVVALFVAVATGLPGALRAGRGALTPALKSGARDGVERSRLRVALLVTQVALSLALLVGAAAFVRSLYAAATIRTGYDTDRLLSVRLRFDDGAFHSDRVAELLPQLEQRVVGLPGIEAAAVTGRAPLSGYAQLSLFRADGSALAAMGEMAPSYLFVSPGFFSASGIALRRGRVFDDHDGRVSPSSLVVNEAMASTLWPGADALDRCLRIGTAAAPCQPVVGVVADANRDGLLDRAKGHASMFYRPMGSGKSEFSLPAVLIVRIAESGRLRAAAGRLAADFRSTLPAGVYASVAPMRDAFDRELRPWTLGATLFVTFGLLALVVATIGTYTATAYQVNRRTRELAIRVALGAAPRTLIRQVLRQGLIPVVVGVGVGIGIALLTGRYIASLLYETSPSSPLVLSVAAFTMIASALAGCLWPALRAARVDPITILRTE